MMTRGERVERRGVDIKGGQDAIRQDLAGLKIGPKIAGARKRAGLTQTALAALAGMPGSKISTLENRIQNVEVSTLLRIARAARCRLHISFEK